MTENPGAACRLVSTRLGGNQTTNEISTDTENRRKHAQVQNQRGWKTRGAGASHNSVLWGTPFDSGSGHEHV